MVNLNARHHMEDLNICRRIILRWALNKSFGECGLELSGSGYRQVAGPCESGNEPWSSIKCGEFLGWLRKC
jgi:hypothetical protein